MTRIFALVAVIFVGVSQAQLPENYNGLTAAEKQEILWQNTARVPHPSPRPSENPGALSMASLFLPTFLVKSFTSAVDEFGDLDRQKLIHTYGSVAKIRLNIDPTSRYTGIFKTGGVGLARLSLAKYDMEKFTPGFAIKICIDGNHPSLNIIAMFSLEGQGSNRNFFQNIFWNVIDGPTSLPLKLLAKAFALSLRLINKEERPVSEENLPLQAHAELESNGNTVANPIAPYIMIAKPNTDLSWSHGTPSDFRTHLQDVPEGSVIYTVAVRGTPEGPEETIGTIVTESRFVASQYGDSKLFFQHHGRPWRAPA